MRRHTAKGVVSSVKLGSEDGRGAEEISGAKESQSRQGKRKVEESTESHKFTVKKRKT